MAQMVSPLMEHHGVKVSCTTDPRIQNALIILHKGYLMNASIEQLWALKKRNVIFADYIDLPPALDQIEVVDGLIASSVAQQHWFHKNVPGKPVFHITHATDRRLPFCDPPSDRFRPAYFGALINAKYKEKLSERLDFIESVPTSPAWIDSVPRYNFHYAVRTAQQWDGFKPFTKGFTAARLQCPIMVSSLDGDALHYLGNDYPYLVADDSFDNVWGTFEKAHRDFGGAEWKVAKQTMEDIRSKSDTNFILSEFQDFVSHYIKIKKRVSIG